MTTDVWRNATPEFAPPEMLQPRAQQTLQQRCSAAIDVYELCGVLYLMYAGHTPYRVAERGGAVAAEIKAEPAPALEARDPVDAPLLDAIMAGLAPAAEKRPRAAELLEAVCSWQRSRGYAVPRDAENTPAPVPGEHGAAHLTISASGRGGLRTGAGTDGGAPGTNRPSGTQAAPSRTLTRRRAIQAAGAAAGVAVLAGAAWATRGFGLLGEPAFKDRSWADLSSLAREIAGADDEKAVLESARQHGLLTDDGLLRDDLVHDLALADGTAATVQVVGIYHDDRADGSGKAGLTFAFTTPIAERAMADGPMASGGWEQCDARAWLADEGLALLPKDLAKRIVEVSKMTNNTGATQDAGNVTATSDKLWLFSIAELGGPRDESTFSVGYRYLAAILSAEGSQYRLWKQQGVSARSGNDALERLDGSTPYQWWNRSPSPDVSADERTIWFNRVGENGDPFHFAKAASDATDHPRLLPGFCL